MLESKRPSTEVSPQSIRNFMLQDGLDERGLSEMLGVDPVTVRRWLKGTSRPTGTAEMILRLLITDQVVGLSKENMLEHYHAITGTHRLWRRLNAVFFKLEQDWT